MLLNRLKLYQPHNVPSNGGAQVLDDPYNEAIWDQDHVNSASRNAIRDQFESLGYASGRVLYVDSVYGNDSTGRKGNILKPFKNPAVAMAYAVAGDLIIVFPGTYPIYAFGLALKDGVDYMLINAVFETTGFAYGSIMVYPSPISCRIFGKGEFRNNSSNAEWAQVTPYVGCDIAFEGIKFTGNKQFIGQLGLLGGDRFLSFKNCWIEANNNIITNYQGAGNYIIGSAYFENCYFKGYISLNNGGGHPSYDYKVKFKYCELQAIDTNSNGYSSSIGLWDYYNDASPSKSVFEHCTFYATNHNLDVGDGFGGIGSNKLLVIKDCYFINGNGEGWIKNENANLAFKMVNNLTRYPASGSSPVNNMITVVNGMIDDPNLE